MSTSALCSSRHLSAHRAVLFLFFCVLIFSTASFADSHARIVRLSYIDGDVELDKADGRGFSTAYLNMPVTNQAKLWARDGQAEVEFEDGSSIRLTPDTIVGFTDLSLDSDGRRNTMVDLQQGTAYFHIRQHETDIFQLQFGRDQVQLAKASHFRVDANNRRFELAVFAGEVEVSNAGGPDIAVRKGETIRLDADDPDRYYLAKGIDSENYDDWDKDRAKNHDEAVSKAVVYGGNNGVTYGYSDLSAYGNYFYVPGYGYMWRPASMPIGWDPFADGYWMFYPGYGYMFVSSYPWGWAPYRYGSWSYVNNYGWCWAPGNTNTWYSVPPLRSMPPRYHPPQVPRTGAPIIAVSNGVTAPVPNRLMTDNDSLEHHRPRPVKIQNASAGPTQQQTTAPAQGFVGSTNTAPATTAPARTATEPVIVGPARQPNTQGGGRRFDNDSAEFRNSGVSRGAQTVQPTVTTPAVQPTVTAPAPIVSAPARTAAPAVPASAPPAPVTMPAHNEVRPAPAHESPRIEPRASAPMRMEPRSMSSAPSMSAGPGMASPSPSMSGGARMSSPSMGGGMGGGGSHSSGGSSGGGGGGHHR